MGRRRGFDGVLDQAGEVVADDLGFPAVEAEDELVEVVLQVLGADGAVVGAQEPTLGEAEDEVDGGQAQAGVAPTGGKIDRLVARVTPKVADFCAALWPDFTPPLTGSMSSRP
jgi:hypothetical protein